MNGFQWFELALQITRLHRLVGRAINEVAELSAEVLTLQQWRTQAMATFAEISQKLDTIVAGQDAAATTAGEIAADIADLKNVIANQTNTDGLSAGQANAIAASLDTIATKSTALQEALATSAAEHTPATPEEPPVEPPTEPPTEPPFEGASRRGKR